VRAVIADETRGPVQAIAFQALFLAMNLAFVLGPLMAEAAIRMECVAAGVVAVTTLELCAGLAALRLMPARKAQALVASTAGGMLSALRDLGSALWLLMVQTLLSYAAVGFLIASLVLYEAINPPLGAWRNWLLSAEGLAVIAVQLALMPLFAQLPRSWIHALVALAAGLGLVLCFSAALPLAFIGLLVFALAECLAMPVAQLELSERAPAQDRRAIFALAMVAAALGEIGGSWLAWSVARVEAAGLAGTTAAQGAGLVLGCGLAGVAWALTRRAGHGTRTAPRAARLAEGRR
jgi:hypothetical protein